MAGDEESITRRFTPLAPHLYERRRRVWLGVEGRELDNGGTSTVARATSMSGPTLAEGVKELDEQAVAPGAGRVRQVTRNGDASRPLPWNAASLLN